MPDLYRRKPDVVEAMRFSTRADGEKIAAAWPGVKLLPVRYGDDQAVALDVKGMFVIPGGYLLRDPDTGVIRSMKVDDFAARYERVRHDG